MRAQPGSRRAFSFSLASPQAGDAPLEGLLDLLMQLLARFAYDLIKWVVNKLREWWRQKT